MTTGPISQPGHPADEISSIRHALQGLIPGQRQGQTDSGQKWFWNELERSARMLLPFSFDHTLELPGGSEKNRKYSTPWMGPTESWS
jgi:hypothetical protein